MDKRITHAALAVLTLALLLAGPASAQIGPDAKPYIYGQPGPGRSEYGPPRPRNRPPPPPADEDWNWAPPPPPPPPPPDDAYDRLRDRYRDLYPRRGGWDDSLCVTSRGTCPVQVGPPGAPCGCEIPGFGYKRGQIGD